MWISKEEYNSLKERLTKVESTIETLEEEVVYRQSYSTISSMLLGRPAVRQISIKDALKSLLIHLNLEVRIEEKQETIVIKERNEQDFPTINLCSSELRNGKAVKKKKKSCK